MPSRRARNAQPQPPPVFRSGAQLIGCRPSPSRTRTARPIEGLTAKDFIVIEDGVPQTISFVEFQRAAGPADPRAALPMRFRPRRLPRRRRARPHARTAPDFAVAARRHPLPRPAPPGALLRSDAPCRPADLDARAYGAAQKFIDTQMKASGSASRS